MTIATTYTPVCDRCGFAHYEHGHQDETDLRLYMHRNRWIKTEEGDVCPDCAAGEDKP